jgi:hypothetical protein
MKIRQSTKDFHGNQAATAQRERASLAALCRAAIQQSDI